MGARHVLALAHPKVRVLMKKPNKKELKDEDTFTFNVNYTNQRVRVNIGVLASAGSKREAEALRQKKVPQQVMKARKKLSHQQLIVEVVHQLQSRFNPDPKFIKERVESLIEREYLERDADDRRTYHYLA